MCGTLIHVDFEKSAISMFFFTRRIETMPSMFVSAKMPGHPSTIANDLISRTQAAHTCYAHMQAHSHSHTHIHTYTHTHTHNTPQTHTCTHTLKTFS